MPRTRPHPARLTTPALDLDIESRIFVMRGRKVMLDLDLARLYGVPTRRLNEQVRRNIGRFPDDFLFRLTADEVEHMRSQSATASSARRNARFRPYAFTEHGVTMLSAVLRSSRAVEVSVAVVRAFVRLRHALAGHTELARKVDELERRYDGQFAAVFEALREILEPMPTPRVRIGFTQRES